MIVQVNDLPVFKNKALQWASSFDAVCYLDSNNFNDPYSKFDMLIAFGVKEEITAYTGKAFDELEAFRKNNSGWVTGFFGYDLKNEAEKLSSNNADHLQFPDLYFFAPLHLIVIKGNDAEIISNDADELLSQIDQQELASYPLSNAVTLKARFTKKEYIEAVENIREHINRGDIYVTNFCQEFYAEEIQINPLAVFLELNTISPNPFSTFFKWKDNYILGASPERFLAKRGHKLISQPIKGTAKRDLNNEADELVKQQLRNHPKELQENVMIVDLVRNDLTKSAKQGTVATEDLFGIYTFRHLHQMISTITCELQQSISPVQAIKNSFPMGSMTGAPKVSAMQLMEQYERSKRGVYSGAAGYFSADDDFDFNVVIRSLLYNADNEYLSFHVGSAITYHAEAEKEYEECLLKAKAILEVLGG
ncbi:anthranilate synthase component I family protein [Mucilaginibacter flavus]|uniref:anthranilate synthase component I family protein n=1 Tax=Mucilaginibacter flavus TaxID=931504 RepID=UPI0025B3C94B|nr:anthranilate synthase component I family protein [Mucilaginibacter flavus]MDN3581162.1 anthranilate synthase component I family protein [Mucilaginibacter flavus]